MPEQEREADERLVDRAKRALEGDMRAFETLVERYQQRVLANCRYLTRSPDDAEDLAQEVFVKVFYGLRRFQGRSTFHTWLHRIKVNHSLNFLRKRAGKFFLDVDDQHLQGREELKVAPDAQKKVEGLGEREKINRILDGMSDTLRVPLILRDLDQLSYLEIAEALNLGLSAVKMRIKRAREEFRRRYEAEEDGGTTAREEQHES